MKGWRCVAGCMAAVVFATAAPLRAQVESQVLQRVVAAEAVARKGIATAPSLAGDNPVHIRVTWTEEPQTRATISWSTASMDRPQSIRYDTESRGGKLNDYRFRDIAHHSGPFDGADSAYFHHSFVQGLKPDTTYYFVVVSGEEVSREFNFTTAPDSVEDFALIYGGDSRSDDLQRSRINLTIAGLVEKDPQILAVVHGGDYIANGRSWPQWLEWLHSHQLMIPASSRIIPIVPARGNHDGGILFDQIFGFPGEGQNYFTTRFSPTATIITTNSEISTAGDQKAWLNDQLGKSRDKTPWLMVQYHRPAFPAVKSPSTVRQNWVPLFERHDVDLVMEADGHCIKRTLPIRDEKPAKDGVVYIGEGGFGVPQRKPDTARWYLQPPGMATSGHHLTHLYITADRLRMRVVDLDGRLVDDHTFTVREKYVLKDEDRAPKAKMAEVAQ